MDAFQEAMMEMVKKVIESVNYSDIGSLRVYHEYIPSNGELKFDLALSPKGLEAIKAIGAPIKPTQQAFLPTTIVNLNVDDAKALKSILEDYIELAEA